jgi:glycine/D-amino acid oxidase-like deaminating enzyme
LVTSFTLSVCVPSAAPEPASPPHPLLPPWVDPSASAAPPRELGTPNSTAQVHPCLLTKAILAASGAEVVIAEVERVVVRDGRAAGVVVKGRERDGVVDADAVVLALGPWFGRLEVVSEVRRFWAQGAQHSAAVALAGEGHTYRWPNVRAVPTLARTRPCRATTKHDITVLVCLPCRA